MINLLQFFLNIDNSIISIIGNYGIFAYFILFLVIFLETGIVVTPFLPGDSLLFAIGTIAASGIINVWVLFVLLSIAAILGDTVNYFLGNYFGERVFLKFRFFNQKHLDRTKTFYEKYGGKTIILARFIPVIRTFAPFVAGIGKMNYPKFLFFNIIGGILWVGLFLFSGYFLGTIPFVKENLTFVVLIIIIASLIPAVIEIIRHKMNK